MKRKISKYETTCDDLLCGVFETLVLPELKKAALKIGVEKIEEMNNYYFFSVGGKDFIEREFCELNKKNQIFFDTYIKPIAESRYQYPKVFKFSMY